MDSSPYLCRVHEHVDSSTDLSSVMDELNKEIVAGGSLMTTVQAIGITIHCHPSRLQYNSTVSDTHQVAGVEHD